MTELVVISRNELEKLITEVITAALATITPPVNDEQLISGDIARKIFEPEISRQTLHNWTKAGSLMAYRLSGRIYYRHSEIISAAKELKLYKKA